MVDELRAGYAPVRRRVARHVVALHEAAPDERGVVRVTHQQLADAAGCPRRRRGCRQAVPPRRPAPGAAIDGLTIRHIIPAQIRRELGIQGESTVIVEAENGRLVVRPAFVIPAEDAWAYTPEHIAKVRKAEAELDAGLGIRMTVDELRAYVGLPPADQDVDDDD